MRSSANHEKPDGPCPTCGRGGGPLTIAELMARALPQAPDPAVVANPPNEEEKAAEAAVAAAQRVNEIATQALFDLDQSSAARHALDDAGEALRAARLRYYALREARDLRTRRWSESQSASVRSA